MKKAAILGAGVMGTAMVWPLSDNGWQVNLIGTHLDDAIIASCKKDNYHPRLKRTLPENVTAFQVEDLQDGLDGAEFIVSGVNSLGVRWIGQMLAPYVNAETRILSITKGLEADEDGDLVILPEILRGQLPENVREKVSIAAVGGPCIAGELAGRRQSCVFFGCEDAQTACYFARIFRTPYYHIQETADLRGLEFSVALKNAYALGVGIAGGVLEKEGGVDSAGAHTHNLAAALFSQAAKEMGCLVAAHGLDLALAYGLPGVGDMYVTSQAGRSVTVGRLLGSGCTIDEAREKMAGETLEAVMVIEQVGAALPGMVAGGMVEEEKLPLMRALVDTILHRKPLDLDLNSFFK